MPDPYRLAWIGALLSMLAAGCTIKNANVPADELMRELQAGQPMLDCRLDCAGVWGANRRKAVLLEATGRWQELALLVMQIGYMDDLTYFYLGRAAEQLGYLQAAQRYYRIAERLSITQLACHRESFDTCDGNVFPDALYPHLEVVEERLAAQSAPTASSEGTRARRVARHRASPGPASRPASSTGPTPASASASAPAPKTGFVEPAPAASASPGFFEPPPVRR